jgi:hypothetical protein
MWGFHDFSKAFDTDNHEILLAKLFKYGIRCHSFEWFNSYLTNRLQFVQIDNVQSSTLTMTCGVPKDLHWGLYYFEFILMI